VEAVNEGKPMRRRGQRIYNVEEPGLDLSS